MTGQKPEGVAVLEPLQEEDLTDEQRRSVAFRLLILRLEARAQIADVAASYEEVVSLFPPDSSRIRKALYLLGLAYYHAEDYTRAKATFERFRDKYGETLAVKRFIQRCTERS
jgi:hypothetical protein